MYESFYGFRDKPFQLNPDPQFYFDSQQHRRAMAYIQYGLHQSEGFIVITGEVGAGKTTLVRSLLANLNPDEVVATNLVSTQLEADDTLRLVAAAFGLRPRGQTKASILLSLEALLTSHASQGKRSLLIVDEAQNLSRRAVEELRMLSNFQLGTHALLQTFLVGQPEFRNLLQSPDLYQLRQRVIAACHVGPLDPDDTRRYIEHRLRRVGWNDVPAISDEAFRVAHEATNGVPRRINLLFDRVLLAGFLGDRRVISAEAVKEVADEIRTETLAPGQVDGPPAVPPARAGGKSRAGAEPALASHHPPDVEQDLQELRTRLARTPEGDNTLGLFRKFVEWVRSHDAERGPKDRA